MIPEHRDQQQQQRRSAVNLTTPKNDRYFSPRRIPRFTFPVNFYGMSVYGVYYACFLCVFLMVNGVVAGLSANSLSCVTNYDTNTDYFPQKISVNDGALFSIQYFNNYKLLTNQFTNETFALYQCGTPAPTTGFPNGTKLFAVPVKSVAVLDTSSNSYLEMLGLRSKITYVGSSADISSPCVQALMNSSITPLSSNTTEENSEFGKVDLVIGAYTADPKQNKSVSTSAPTDPGTLKRIEWLEFYATFFNLEYNSTQLVSQIDNNYNCLKNLSSKNAPSKKVAWVAYEAPDQYDNNTATWSIADAVYKKQLTEDAGGVYFNTTPLVYSTSSDFLKAIQDVDILIDESLIAPNLSAVLTNFGLSPTGDNSAYKFVKNKQIYREDGLVSPSGSGLDWYESAIPMEDAVLEDLISVINPSLPNSKYQRIWLRNVATGEQQKFSSAANCTDSNAPFADRATNCSAYSGASKADTGSAIFSFSIGIALIATAFLIH